MDRSTSSSTTTLPEETDEGDSKALSIILELESNKINNELNNKVRLSTYRNIILCARKLGNKG